MNNFFVLGFGCLKLQKTFIYFITNKRKPYHRKYLLFLTFYSDLCIQKILTLYELTGKQLENMESNINIEQQYIQTAKLMKLKLYKDGENVIEWMLNERIAK